MEVRFLRRASLSQSLGSPGKRPASIRAERTDRKTRLPVMAGVTPALKVSELKGPEQKESVILARSGPP